MSRTGMVIGLALASAGTALAQMTPPTAPKLTGAQLFQRQCGTCHSVVAGEPQRQGPSLVGVIGRKAGSAAGYHYSAGFAKADWAWDDAHLDPWLTNPQAVIPGAVMPYRQSKAAVRAAIIAYLHEVR